MKLWEETRQWSLDGFNEMYEVLDIRFDRYYFPSQAEQPGKEVVQVYVHDHKASLVRPLKELKGFAKIELKPGETRTATIHLDFRAFAFYHPGYSQWITESGDFDILIGASSADIRCVETVTFQSTLELPCILTRDSTLGDWLADPCGKEVIAPLYQEIIGPLSANFGGEPLSIEVMAYLKSLPLADVLEFPGVNPQEKPAEVVEGLLKQVR